MNTKYISKEDARRFLVTYHNLDGRQNYSGLNGVVQYFNKVKSIQYDPLNVVGRNADLVLQSKISEYKPEMLQKLLYTDHMLVDGFDKEMCIYLADDYLKFERIRVSSGIATKNTLKHRGQLDALDILDEVRDYIIKHGTIRSQDISIGQSTASRWGHKKLSSATLDYLYTIGELCVANKKGTHKFYDFTANVLHVQHNELDPFKDEDEFLCWYVKHRIDSVGLVWDKNGGAWQGHFISDKNKREKALHHLLVTGEVIQVKIEDIKSPFYIKTEDEQLFTYTNQVEQVKFLAPLDNILWDREKVKQLFNFEYSWEVYTPIIKRKYGYYVLPVLYGNKLIARFEPDKAKKSTPFRIKNWWWEPNVAITKDLLDSINTAIVDFCRYLDAEYTNDYDDVILRNS